MHIFIASHDDTPYPTKRIGTATLRLPGIERLVERPAPRSLTAADADALIWHAAHVTAAARLGTIARAFERDRPELLDLLGL